MIYLYGAVDDEERAASALAGSGADPAILRAGVVPCLGVRYTGAFPDASADRLREHDAVVTELMKLCTIVPFRYGTVIDDGTDLDVLSPALGNRLEWLLVWLRDRVEIALRASVRKACTRRPTSGLSGRAYLHAIRSEHEGTGELDRLHRILVRHSVAAACQFDGRFGIRGSYLIEASEVEGFCEAAQAAAAPLETIADLSLTGPWAPYSFVDGAAEIANATGEAVVDG